MNKECRKIPWDVEGSYLERSISRDKAFNLLQRKFNKGPDDRQKPNGNISSPEVPVDPKPPIIMGGGKKLE